MHAPLSTPDALPARVAIMIIGCLIVVLAALWLFIVTKTMIAMGVGALALLIAGTCAFAYRHGLKPM
jgi:hypothetical protein